MNKGYNYANRGGHQQQRVERLEPGRIMIGGAIAPNKLNLICLMEPS
jgi:hypothetical protein